MYDLEMERVISEIRKSGSKRILIQLPEGLIPWSGKICDEIKEKTSATAFIWAGSCFGACDTPSNVKSLGIDMLIQWGHSRWG